MIPGLSFVEVREEGEIAMNEGHLDLVGELMYE
jgi:hypothetical protein